MTDDKADNITQPDDEVVKTASTDAPPADAQAQSDAGTGENKLSGLMAGAETPQAKPEKPAVDLEADAMRAAEQAVAEGEKALAEASAQLHEVAQTSSGANAKSRFDREFILRALLAVNVLAMVVVAMLPSPPKVAPKPQTPVVTEQLPKGPPVRQMSEPVNRALQASENRDFAGAVAILEAYLGDNPRMHSAERLSVLLALSLYASRNNDFAKSQKYAQQAQALEQSHSLPEDLVHMAEAAVKNGDQESLRRIWARFLLQQRQIPTWLYQHVAQAYLQLGDSYRTDADRAAELARRKELDEAAARLRAEAIRQGGGK